MQDNEGDEDLLCVCLRVCLRTSVCEDGHEGGSWLTRDFGGWVMINAWFGDVSGGAGARLTRGRVHDVLLRDVSGTGGRGLVHLQHRLTRVLPGRGLVQVTAGRERSKVNSHHTRNTGCTKITVPKVAIYPLYTWVTIS